MQWHKNNYVVLVMSIPMYVILTPQERVVLAHALIIKEFLGIAHGLE
jgi:hypothetical protein